MKSLRLLFAASALGLILAPPAAAIEYRSIHGADAKGYQSWFDKAVQAGLRPLYLTGFGVGRSARFAGVAIEDEGGVTWEARHALTASKYQQTMDDLSKQGFRPLVVNGYSDGGARKFAAIWIKDGVDVAWQARHDLTSQDYQQLVADLGDEGYRPSHISAYPDGAACKFAAIFIKDGADWVAKHDLTPEQYQADITEWAKKGYRPSGLCGYQAAGGVRYAFVLIKDDIAWTASNNLTSDRYQQAFDKAKGEGYRPVCISAYPGQGGLRYAAAWVKDVPKPGRVEEN